MKIIMKDWAIMPSEKNGIYDVYCPKELIMGSGDVARIDLGFRIELPIKCVAILVGRSGLANKGIDPLEFSGNQYMSIGGILSKSGINDWGVVLKNFGALMVNIKKGDKIASFILIETVSEAIEIVK